MKLDNLEDNKGREIIIIQKLFPPEVTSECYEIKTSYGYNWIYKNGSFYSCKYNNKPIIHRDLFEIIDKQFLRREKLKNILK